MRKSKWGKDGPGASDFGWIVVNFIGMLIVKMVAFLIMRAAFRYFRNKFATWKQKKEKNVAAAATASRCDYDDIEDDDTEDQRTSVSPPSRNKETDNFDKTIKSEDIQNELKRWAEAYSITNKVDVEAKEPSKILLEKIRERHRKQKNS